MRHRSNDDAMAETYKREPQLAADLLNYILEDKDSTVGEVLTVLRQMALACGGIQAVAAKAELNPTQIYRTLSPEGNPELKTAIAILKALGLQLQVKRIQPAKKYRVAKAGRPAKVAKPAKAGKLAKAA